MSGEAASLQNVPKLENDDLKKSIIRTTIKNENLLAKKMEMSKIRKKGNKKLNRSLKHKTDRSSRVDGVLATKIQLAVERAKYVQNARKSGWDLINKSIAITNDLIEKTQPKSEEELEREAEDEYVKQFFTDETVKPVEKEKKDGNIFAMLEVEE